MVSNTYYGNYLSCLKRPDLGICHSSKELSPKLRAGGRIGSSLPSESVEKHRRFLLSIHGKSARLRPDREENPNHIWNVFPFRRHSQGLRGRSPGCGDFSKSF